MSQLLTLKEWTALGDHFQRISGVHLRDLFQEDNERFSRFSLETCGLFLDYSKNHVTDETISLFVQLLNGINLPEKIESLFRGDMLNPSEQQAALHTALRDPSADKPIQHELQKMQLACDAILQGKWTGYTNKAFTDVVNIGIGGSDLGPLMATTALTPYHQGTLRCHFVSNMDGSHISDIFRLINPETTLFIVASKSFTTQETLCNAKTALALTGHPEAIKDNFIAITARKGKAIEFGIPEKNILHLWDWVGGRYSLWSTIGLPIALCIGMENFNALLKGAHAMDTHFRDTPFRENMPVIMAALAIWYNNFFQRASHAVMPYDHHLRHFTSYLQQLEMESLGKNLTLENNKLDYPSGPIIWGGVGSNCQHSYHQLLHQGTQTIPVDFILPVETHHNLTDHHKKLVANCFSQSKALMRGTILPELPIYERTPGNRPSNTLLLEKLTPHTLGALIALYEHKVFVQSVIWDINAFDQWGVELGKRLGREILQTMAGDETISHDCSTQGLISHFMNRHSS